MRINIPRTVPRTVAWKLPLLVSWLLLFETATPVVAANGNPDNPGIASPQFPAFGKSYGQWLNEYFKWWAAAPADLDPLADPTGQHVASGQSGDVWFLATSYVGTSPKRAVTIPSGKALFFVIAFSVWTEADDPSSSWSQPYTDPDTGKNYSSGADWSLQDAKSSGEGMIDLCCEIDGTSVQDLRSYLALSPESFHVVVPQGGGQAGPPGACVGIGAGYCLMLDPLPAGAHTIHAAGVFPDEGSFDLTDTITVSGGPTLSMVHRGSTISVSFTGVLQSAGKITGPWSDVPGGSPQTIATTGAATFYRARQ